MICGIGGDMTQKRPGTDQLAMFLGSGAVKPNTKASDGREWSPQQVVIFDAVRAPGRNLAVQAGAGTGKTTTVVEMIKRIPSNKRVLYAAFNVPIKDDVKPRFAGMKNVDVKTLHGVGFSVLRQNDDTVQVDQEKGYLLAKEVAGPDAPAKLAGAVKRAAGYLKNVGFDESRACDTVEEAESILVDAEIDADAFVPLRDLATLALSAMRASKDMLGVVDFDDQIWLPVVLGLRPKWGYDYVFIDEAQDMGEAQLRLLLSVVKPGGRIVIVGDPRQAIYGWRGADPKMWTKLIARLDAKVYPLTVTYRCAKSIVAEANTIVRDLQAKPGAPDGVVQNIDRAQMLKMIAPGDFVLSRANAPLVDACTSAIRAGIKSNIQGRDLGETLSALIDKARADDVDELIEWVEAWRLKNVEKRQKKGHDPTPIMDRAACLIAFCEGAKTVGEVRRNIATMFDDGDDRTRVIFSSVHRAKGLERERVFILRPSFMKPRPYMTDDGVDTFGVPVEEENLYYVAVTRAKSALYIVG